MASLSVSSVQFEVYLLSASWMWPWEVILRHVCNEVKTMRLKHATQYKGYENTAWVKTPNLTHFAQSHCFCPILWLNHLKWWRVLFWERAAAHHISQISGQLVQTSQKMPSCSDSAATPKAIMQQATPTVIVAHLFHFLSDMPQKSERINVCFHNTCPLHLACALITGMAAALLIRH